MISARALRDNLNPLLKMSQRSGMDLRLHYKGKVYRLRLEPTDEVYKKPRQTRKTKKGKVMLLMRDCRECLGILVDGKCVNKRCPSYRNGEHLENPLDIGYTPVQQYDTGNRVETLV